MSSRRESKWRLKQNRRIFLPLEDFYFCKIYSISRMNRLKTMSQRVWINNNNIFLLFCSKSKDICFTFRLRFRDFMKILLKCHLRFLFYCAYIDRSFIRQFSLHELHNIIRELVEVFEFEIFDDFSLNYYN